MANLTTYDVIKAGYPEADAELANFILWARTPYPAGNVSPRSLYKAASGFKRATENRIRLCEWCRNRAESGCCTSCNTILDRSRKQIMEGH